MTARAVVAVAEARRVADYLDSIGEPMRAEAVRRVCRSNSRYRGAFSVLLRDNMELRCGASSAQA